MNIEILQSQEVVFKIKSSVSNDQARELLQFDPLDVAKKMTGKDYHDDQETGALGFLLHLKKSQQVKQVMQEREDSYYGISFIEMEKIVKDLSFQEIYSENFQGRSSHQQEILKFFWNGSILLAIDSYGSDLNSAHIHFNLKFNNDDDFHKFVGIGCSGHYNNEHSCWVGTKDVREGFKLFIEETTKLGEYLTTWVESPWLYLHAYTDYDPPYHISDSKTNIIPDQLILKRLESIPKHIQNNIQVAIVHTIEIINRK